MNEDYGFLGTGMKFPPQVNTATGRFEMVSAEESVKESVYLILMTRKNERFIHPDFGSSLMSFTFMDGNNSMLNLMAAELKRDIIKNEPRIKDVDVKVEPELENGCMNVIIDYTIRENNHEDNLVFPFYINGRDGGKL